ncbi:pyridoxamine 5'-phosphate oxidase family protein [Kibdelosporangium philippinense]|uniref:Pyridoxamine 5'-phosphate oxidase family protein n=1 Tax=Kibdelosporangium philippinense TaxID=211113 RepID=A0ABS8ZQX8_9PSEU|nr:pyridoxamine 5'-phosphate oxidase family protein [Kibdelosporangium philippinense]MCE7008217.1 pyridoxamine 5'-phosphate oxidase family protein [Kibdelosporangium philippinense]
MPPEAAPGKGAALLVLLPGWRETLRINGTVETDGLAVEEAFLHCGKAIIRSNLWGPATSPGDDFLAAAPFAVITSRDGNGNADASPKGDPQVIRQIGPSTIAIAERPGNRRTDTFHNILEQPEIAIVAVAPGDNRTLEITGTARITTDLALRESMSERGRTPKAVLVVETSSVHLADSPALRDADLWNAEHHIDPAELPRPSEIWTAHVKLNESKGLAARTIRALVNERMTRAGTNLDYRQNLY